MIYRILTDFLSHFRWYRKRIGGSWHYNRYWFDMGRSMLCVWEKRYYGRVGGASTTLKSEAYYS